MNCHLPHYYTGVLLSYVVSEEHSQGQELLTETELTPKCGRELFQDGWFPGPGEVMEN